jgi:hypothetical protein
MVSAGVPAAAVALIAVDIPGVPAVTRVSAVADLTYLLLLVLQVSDVPSVAGVPAVVSQMWLVNHQTVDVVFNGSGVLAVGFTYVPVISCAVVGPYVSVVISVGVTATANVPTVINIPCARRVSTGSSVLAIVGILCCSSCLLCCCRPGVDVFLPLLFHPWSLCYD